MKELSEIISRAALNVHACEVCADGRTVQQHFFHGDVRYPVYSATKTVTAAAALIAHAEKRLDIHAPLCQKLGERYRRIAPEAFGRLTFADFMSMQCAPYPFRPTELEGSDENWLEAILSYPADYGDRRYHYSNIPAYLVSAACENAVDMPLAEYLGPRLFEPLGWGSPKYCTSPEGHFYGATGMELTLSQLARLGRLLLGKGSIDGRQLIPAELVGQAVEPRCMGEEFGYGYFIRIIGNCFEIKGKWGQSCIVCPDKRLVVTCLADEKENSSTLSRLLYEYIGLF